MNAPPPAPDNFFYMEEKKPVCTSYPSDEVKGVGGNWNQKSIVEHKMDRWMMNRWKEGTWRKRRRKQKWREWRRKQESIYRNHSLTG